MLKGKNIIKIFCLFKNDIKVSMGILVLALLISPTNSFADFRVNIDFGPRYYHRDRDYWEHHYYRWQEHPHYGWRAHYLPEGCREVWSHGTRYYYYDGLYYSYTTGDYVVVQPPGDVVVPQLPSGFRMVHIDGQTYFTDNGIYYMSTPSGYRIVNPSPEGLQVVIINGRTYYTDNGVYYMLTPNGYTLVDPPLVSTSILNTQMYTVNVPTNQGGYTTVLIRRRGTGYIGPQGEYYMQFPSVQQLSTMYGQ